MELVFDILHPVLPDAFHTELQAYFNLMGEIGIDEVVSAMGMIIRCFSEHIQPHAEAIAIKVRENVVYRYHIQIRAFKCLTLRPDMLHTET
jgi:hypothetical protein